MQEYIDLPCGRIHPGDCVAGTLQAPFRRMPCCFSDNICSLISLEIDAPPHYYHLLIMQSAPMRTHTHISQSSNKWVTESPYPII